MSNDAVRDAMEQRVGSGAADVPGLVWAISRKGETEVGVEGTHDVERDIPTERDSIYRISSMSKPITAAAALLLVDDGRLTLDDPVDDLLPELADRQVLRNPEGPLDDTVPADRPITTRDLLTFRLGLGMEFSARPQPTLEAMAALDLGSGPPQPALPPEPDEWMRRLGTVPLAAQPGERWLYHTGADVLGVLVARAAGQPFEDFLHERLFGPLGMVDTSFSVPKDKLDRFGPLYNGRTIHDPRDGQWATPPAFPGGGAGLVSTLDDILAFGQMLLAEGVYDGDQILSPELVTEMTRNHLTDEQLATSGPSFDGSLGWGLGLSVRLEAEHGASVGTYGWNGGLGTGWSNDPTEGVVAILLTNQMWTSPVPPPVFQAFWAAL